MWAADKKADKVDAGALPIEKNENEIRVPYQPECNTKNLREFLKRHATTLAGLTLASPFVAIVVYCLFGYFISGAVRGVNELTGIDASNTWTLITILLMVPLPLLIPATIRLGKIVFQPTHLLIRPDGIYVQWQQKIGRPVKPIVKWHDVGAVNLRQVEDKTKESEQFLVFERISAEGLALNNVAASFLVKDGPQLPLMGKQERAVSLAGLDLSSRKELLDAIRTYISDVPRNPGVTALLEPPPEQAYTELWLNALTASPDRESLTPLSPGAVLKNGKYRIASKIAVGGQGTAYDASCAGDKGAETRVVLKEYVLPTHVGIKAKNESIETLRNEAEILRKLVHPNVVTLLDYFVEDHRGYLVLEHIEGTNLKDLIIKFGPLPEKEVRRLGAIMCETLAFLHGESPPIVHRDFTPDNLILTIDGALKLIDFNVARQTTSTVTATVVGKHAYIPLEQFRGKPVPQSDIFALGCILHYLLTGREPEPLTTSSPKAVDPDISKEMNDIVERATQLECSKRYATAGELLKELCGHDKITH